MPYKDPIFAANYRREYMRKRHKTPEYRAYRRAYDQKKRDSRNLIENIKRQATFPSQRSTGIIRANPDKQEKAVWIPKPVNTEIRRLNRQPTIYLCERPTCKRTFQRQPIARRHFLKVHYND